METINKLKSIIEAKGKNSYDEVGQSLGYKGETLFQWIRSNKIPSKKIEKELKARMTKLAS